jgi:hypothetical protein
MEWLPHVRRSGGHGELNPLRHMGFSGTPGETRTPNLLIRRSPSRVHESPHGLERRDFGSTDVHSRPWEIHRERLPTWLPGLAGGQRAVKPDGHIRMSIEGTMDSWRALPT